LVYFEPGPDVVCQCGIVYSWDGWLVGGTNTGTPYFADLLQQQEDRYLEMVAEKEAMGEIPCNACGDVQNCEPGRPWEFCSHFEEPEQDVGPQHWPPGTHPLDPRVLNDDPRMDQDPNDFDDPLNESPDFDQEPEEFPDGEFPDPRRYTRPDWELDDDRLWDLGE